METILAPRYNRFANTVGRTDVRLFARSFGGCFSRLFPIPLRSSLTISFLGSLHIWHSVNVLGVFPPLPHLKSVACRQIWLIEWWPLSVWTSSMDASHFLPFFSFYDKGCISRSSEKLGRQETGIGMRIVRVVLTAEYLSVNHYSNFCANIIYLQYLSD